MSDQENPLLSVKELTKYYHAKKGAVVKAVDNVSFDIMRGETFSLVGESGCGKTTCGRTILGVYPKTSGNIIYDGLETSTFSKKQKKVFSKQAQMIFQDPYSCLDPRMTISSIIQEGIHEHFSMSAAQKHERVLDLLNKVGLRSDFVSRFPHELSGGQRQRVGIARALALDPQFIVCDEPIAALDVSIQAQIINLLISLQRELKLTYLFISHDLSMVRHISDRIGVMYLGSIVELSGTNDIYRNPLHPYTQALFSAILATNIFSGSENKRIRLEGEVPSPVNPPSGCKFRTRCQYAKDVCSSEIPTLKEIETGHFVACHLY
ncbi:ABC transporter ATP-binding protein [Cohnella abietis]|uniref:ABC transporter ATP-binding protein n=1 Tax=Cohnella abietis TaxID=2507935 RepID=A0A3T1DB01_9BACL|nr:oligopeptide/dipeptide ABC transporter ATP-binding protein [Cohnella abietis]BBI35214.1 ABC transporter ATP-binding protein [Cohnella abietis]